MKILLTNDDGYMAPGLLELFSVLRKSHDVCVVAPEVEHSGQSHAMTLKHPLLLRRHADLHYSCSGTPVDCVLLVQHQAIDFKPDLVVSGINRGPNLGTDLVYSGTAAAARQAAMSGIPGIAVSLAEFHEPFKYSALAGFVEENVEFLRGLWEPGIFFNINAPNAESGHAYESCWTGLCQRVYKDTMEAVHTSGGTSFCFYTEGCITTIEDIASDEYAVAKGYASITPVDIVPHVSLSWMEKHAIQHKCPLGVNDEH